MADEISDIVLDGTSFMLYGDHSLTASVANPAGLRTSGADLLRDVSQWSERELERMDAGAGQVLAREQWLPALYGQHDQGWVLPAAQGQRRQHLRFGDGQPRRLPASASTSGHTYMACGAKLYAIDRLNNGSITKLWIKLAEKPAGTGWEWPTWTNETPIDAASGLLKGNYFYTQLLSYGPYLIALMDEDVSSMTAAAAALPGTQQIPAAGEPNSKAFCGIMVIDPDTGADLPPIPNWAATPSVLYHAGISGSMLYTQQPDPTDQTPDGVTRYNGNLSLAYGGTIFNGALYVWDGFRVAYTSATPDLLATIPPAEAGGPIWWQWWVIELPSAKYQIGSHHSPWGIALASGNDIYNAQPEREVITGMVALQGQTLNDFSKYLSTNTGLYAILSGDVIKSVMTWGSMAWWNGLGAIQHQGDAYFP